MKDKQSKPNNLHAIAQFSLFVTSYLPLFFLIILRQLFENYEFLNWGGISIHAIILFINNFGLSFLLTILSLFGWYGYRKIFQNIIEVAVNGFPVTIKDIRNKNNESIGYIATYIIPFLFQKFNSTYECIAVFFLLLIIYRIYINSTLIIVNPILSIWYSIYEIEFEENGCKRNGLVISRDRYLQEETQIKLYAIGHKLYFSSNEE